jgi:hypothetical protein
MNEEVECKTHPDAPHGFVRNASHTEDRLVCECEYWEEPKMNERIKQLALQAEQTFGGTFTFNGGEVSMVNLEKFAELIVLECADWIDRQDETRCPYGVDLVEHFGVEE